MSLAPIDSRLLKVLVKLNSKKYNKLDELAEFMSVSTRTIQNYIKQLNEIMKEGIAKIVNVKGEGYKLVVENKDKFVELMQCPENNKNEFTMLNDSENRLLYIIKLLIDLNQTITIDELAFKINIGRTTLVNDLKKVRQLLKIYNIKLSGKQNSGIKIVGSEINIRLLILDYICKGFEINISHEKVYCQLKNDIIDIFSVNEFHITDKTINKIMNYIFVMMKRLESDKFIHHMDSKYFEIKKNNEYSIALKIKSLVEKTFKCELNDNETVFLTMPLIGREAPINKENITIRSNMKFLLKKIIDEINNNFSLSIELESEIVKNLKYHLNFMINRLIFNISIKNTLLDDIKIKYPLPYEMAKLAAKIIERNYNLKVEDDEIGYIALYFESYIEQNNSENNIKKIALVCGTGLGTAQLLKIKLSKMLIDKDVQMDTFSDVNLTGEVLDNYDIVFTTVDLNISTDIPIIKINALFNEEDLRRELDRKINFKKYNIKYIEENLSVLGIVIQPQFFFILNKNNYFNNLNDMLVKISASIDIDTDFKEKVTKRELKSPTLLGNYIALPHSVNKKSSRLSIAIGILETPIVYNEREIKVIIMLIVPTEDKIDSEILIKAYDEILKLGQNKKIIKKICKIRDYNEFKNILLKEVNP